MTSQAAPPESPDEVDAILRRHGLRATSQRRRVVAALHERAHLTPEQVAAAVAADGGAPVPPSTVYRALDTLEELGVVTHTHLTHGAPTYHLAGHRAHLHLVCRGCGDVVSADLALAGPLVDAVRSVHGFEADVEHMGIHGRCARCTGAPAPQHRGEEAHEHDVRPREPGEHDEHDEHDVGPHPATAPTREATL